MPAYSKARKIVAERDAVLVSRSSRPLLGTIEIVRHWPRVIDDTCKEAVEFLDLYTSTKNRTPSFRVVKPATGSGKTEHDGTWRCAGNRMAETGEEEGIYQVLRKGFATQLNSDESRIHVATGNPQTKSLVLVQYWPNIAPDVVATLVNTLKDTTSVTNPKHHLGETLSGTFAVSSVRGELADDGSGIILRTLSQVTAVSEASDLDSLGQVVVFNKEALHLFALQSNDSAATEGTQYALAVTWTNIANTVAVRDVCCGKGDGTISDSDLEDKVDSIPDVGGMSWTYVDRRWSENANGTASLTALFRRVDLSNDWENDAIERSEHSAGPAGASDNAWAASWLYRAEDIPTAGVIDEYLAAAQEDLSDEDQGVVGVTLQEQGPGRFAVSQQVRRFYTGTASGDAIILHIKPGMAGAQTPTILRVWWRRTETAKNTLTASDGEARSSYTFESNLYDHADCTITDHGDGAYTIRQILVFTADGQVYFHHHWPETAIRTRTSSDTDQENQVKIISYEQHRKAFSSEDAAMVYLKSLSNAHDIKAGSVSGVQRQRFLYVLRWTERTGISGWQAAPAAKPAST